jgi:hypothetical protein
VPSYESGNQRLRQYFVNGLKSRLEIELYQAMPKVKNLKLEKSCKPKEDAMAKINGNELHNLVDEFGEPGNSIKLSKKIASKYHGLIPSYLIDFWIEHGFGSYQRGKFWITDPEVFKPFVEHFFKGDPEFSPDDLYCIYRGAFAELGIWNPQKKCILEISMNLDLVTINSFEYWVDNDTGLPYPIEQIVAAIIYRQKYTNAWVDEDDNEILDDVIAKCGPLLDDEMYGFFPALQLGGKNIVNNIQRVKAVKHLIFLSQLSNNSLNKFVMPDAHGRGGGYQFIRRIGPANK